MMHSDSSDVLEFAAEEPFVPASHGQGTWKLLVVDDEEEVHSITRMVLDGFEFEGRTLEILGAESAEDGWALFQKHADVAVAILDVVMETPQAGLDLVHRVRKELRNTLVRIILRTGQPGQAPERRVITEYDINDYKSKAELTAQKLHTSVISAIRSYRDMRAILRSRRGLEEIIHASAKLFEAGSLEPFARGVLTQMTALLHLEESWLYLEDTSGFAAMGRQDFVIIAGTGVFSGLENKAAHEVLDTRDMALIDQAVAANETVFDVGCFVSCFETERGKTILFLRLRRALSDFEQDLLRVFAGNAAVAFENLQLNHEVAATHREVILTLGEVVESRALISGMHVHRVAEMARRLGEYAGLSQQECEMLQLAMPMHDVGKVAIPDSVLLKPGPLDEAEQRIMREHARLGHDILSRSDQPIMRMAARIALEHQESWDGSGYPQGLAGERIHIMSRIARVVDVLDSLLSRRVYKEPWSVPDALAYLLEQRGRMFDPRLVDLVLAHSAQFLALREQISSQTGGFDLPCAKKT